MFRKPKPIETVDDCFKDESRKVYCRDDKAAGEQAIDRLKRLREEERKQLAPCKAPKTLLQQSAQLVIEGLLEQGKTEAVVAALVAKGQAETVVKQMIGNNPAAVKQIVKGLMSTAAGIRAIPKVRRPEMQEVVVVQTVDDEGQYTQPPRYVWLNKHPWLQELFWQDSDLLEESPRAPLGGWTLKWTKNGDALEWVKSVLSGLEWDAPQGVYLDANFDELMDWGSDDEYTDRDGDGMSEYDRFMDDCARWNQDHYEEYAPRFVQKINDEVLTDVMTPAQVDEEFTRKSVSLDIVGTLTIDTANY